MATEGLKCLECNMLFGDASLLQKHKERFCIGGQVGDPEVLKLHRGLRDVGPAPSTDIPEDTTETPRYDPSKDARVKELAAVYGQQKEFFHKQNLELEKQREEIRRQLEQLAKRQVVKDDNTDELLRDLREQEERSQKLLEELRRQLEEARRPVNILQQTQTTEEPEVKTKTYLYPLYHGGSLVSEIITMKETYVKNGGSDPQILSQMDQMLEEARALEESMKNAPKPKPKESKEDSSQLVNLEMENERLQQQLILLQEQKLTSARSQKDTDREGDLEREIRRMRREHLRRMQDLQKEMERLRQDSVVDRLRLELQLQNQAPAQQPQLPTRIVLQQAPRQPPPAAPAPPTQREVVHTTRDVLVPYDPQANVGPIHTYGHTWVHTQHRQDAEEDPDFDLQL